MKEYMKPVVEEIKFSTEVITQTETPSADGMDDIPE